MMDKGAHFPQQSLFLASSRIQDMENFSFKQLYSVELIRNRFLRKHQYLRGLPLRLQACKLRLDTHTHTHLPLSEHLQSGGFV